MYIDCHCHLTDEKDFESVGGVDKAVETAYQNGVGKMICSGYDLSSSIRAKELAESYPFIYFCAGFHPSELEKYKDGDLDEIEKLLRHEKCVALGEIGLDYHFDNNPEKAFQKELFIKQLLLADKVGLPIVIHSRDSAQDTLEILTEHKHLLKWGGVMHCYSYSPEMAERFLDLGLHFSFGGPCTFKNANKVVNSVERIPAHRLLSETDCPYLTPVPFRGEFPNTPKHIPVIVEKLAEIKGVSVDEMKNTVYNNAKKLFFKLQ